MFVKERFVFDIDPVAGMKPVWGYLHFSEAAYYRTYSRLKSDGSHETWNETVRRVIEGVLSIRKDWYTKNHVEWKEEFWQEYGTSMAISMFKMRWFPAGRGLQQMGTEFVYNRGSMALNNCAFKLIENLDTDCAWIMDALMNGVGVGFKPTRDELVLTPPTGSYDYLVPDSREGWVELLQLTLRGFMGDDLPEPDFSGVRPYGVRIKGFGGTASGPGPLKELIEKVRERCYAYIEGELDVVELKCDIANLIGCCVVAGNIRRSAEIACMDINDPVFLDLKDYTKYPDRASWGWMSNNSVYLKDTEDFDELGQIAARVIKNGEPGIINLRNIAKGRIGDSKYQLRPDRAIGFNPCIRKTTKLLTKHGIRNLEDCDIGTEIWSETGWTKIINKWSTGENRVYAYRTKANVFYGTDNHRILYEGMKIPVQDAPGIDVLVGKRKPLAMVVQQAVVDGLVIGDGGKGNKILLYIGKNDQDYFKSEIKSFIGDRYDRDDRFKIKTTIKDLDCTYNRTVPDTYLHGDHTIVCSFLRGLFSANGCVVADRVQLKSASHKLVEQVQMMLSSVGIRSYCTTNKEHNVKHRNGSYKSKESYDLCITHDRDEFQRVIGFLQEYKNQALQLVIDSKYKSKYSHKKVKDTYDIVSVEYLGVEETFDITVDNTTHTYWTQGCNVSNCGEIPLEDCELCNLVETVPTRCTDENDWYEACAFATLYASTVSLLPTHDARTNRVVARNRRIGVGIIDFIGWKEQVGVHAVTKFLREGYNVVRMTNSFWNDEAGIPHAVRVTTMKPGGTSPKLPGKKSGMGHANFQYMLRRMRVQRYTSIEKIFMDAGVRSELCVNQPDYTRVFEFPIYTGPERPAAEVSLWEQASNLILLQREWADNAVSNTLNFRPKYPQGPDGPIDPRHEEGMIEAVLSSTVPQIKSLSMLPHTADGVYPQMPESEISSEEYYERLSEIKPFDWSTYREDVEEEKYCGSQGCEIPR